MKTVITICIGLLWACYIYFGIFALHNLYTENKVEPVKSMLVKCKDGTEYIDTLDSSEEFKCAWKEIVFNF